MYEVCLGKVGRFIHCSTVSVYMISHDVQCPITEDQTNGKIMPFFPRNPFGRDYGIQKRECEKFLWNVHNEKTFPVTTIRPPYVCGPGDRAKRDYFWIERILDGKPLLVPGSGDFATQTVFVNDLARAFVDLLEYQETIGQAFNVASEEIFSLNDYLRKLAQLLKKEIELVHVDQDIFDGLPFSYSNLGDVFPFNTRRTAIFNLEKIKSAIGFESTNFNFWMTKTIEWFLHEYRGHSTGYEFRNDEVRFAEFWKKSFSAFSKDVLK
jgi:nucleoside-diphosphate-sugar epimerase